MQIRMEKFKAEHFKKLKPRNDPETMFHYNIFKDNQQYVKLLESYGSIYSFFNKDNEIVMIAGGYVTTPNTGELLLYAGRFFEDNMIQCIKILRKMITTDRDSFIPAHICRLEMNCNMAFPKIIRFATKGMKFSPVGIRHKLGIERQEDYLLLERIL